MCAHYEGVIDPLAIAEHFKASALLDSGKHDLWPGYLGAFIRKHPHADSGDDAISEREAVPGVFGLLPNWATDSKLARSTYNARSETVAAKPSFRDAWKKSRHCVIPAVAIYEPDWRSGKAISTLSHVPTAILWESPDCGTHGSKSTAPGYTATPC